MVRRAGLRVLATAVGLVAALTVTAEVAPVASAGLPDAPATVAPSWARGRPAGTTQVVRTISSHFWCDHPWCTVTQAWRKVDGTWTIQRHFRSTIAQRGWGKRREGDMRSPGGVYTVKVTFSTGRSAPGRMPWKRRKPTSVVSAGPGRLYNTWIEQSWRTDGDRPSMRYGFVVDYNNVRLRPFKGPKPVAGKGSGIFYHTSRPGREWVATEGCTQVGNVANMKWLVRWLRPSAHPRIVQNR
jgi:L,D-peptidoglycan transpeptidase YkuD (ErfK/YbiS/YcfS/YnhG family)